MFDSKKASGFNYILSKTIEFSLSMIIQYIATKFHGNEGWSVHLMLNSWDRKIMFVEKDYNVINKEHFVSW